MLLKEWNNYLMRENKDNLRQMALHTSQTGEGQDGVFTLLLYNAHKFYEDPELIKSDEDMFEEGVTVAMLRIDGREVNGRCWEAGTIDRSASSSFYRGRGYGKLLYEFAGVLFYYITSDRGSVSSHAKKVWDKLSTKATEKKPFDNVLKPKTPPEIDDCIVGFNQGIDYAISLDKGLRSKRQAEMNELVKKDAEIKKFLMEETGLGINEIKRQLQLASGVLFRNEYNAEK